MIPFHVSINFELTGLRIMTVSIWALRFLRLFYNLRQVISEVETRQVISLGL